MLSRCKYDCKAYAKYRIKNIQVLLTFEDFRKMWDEQARYLISPTVHRVDNDGDYSINNIVFVEKLDHLKLHRKRKEDEIRSLRAEIQRLELGY